MKRVRLSSSVLVALLVLLMPLEQGHCAWMGLESHAAPAAASMPPGHDCCASDPAPQPEQPASQPCGPEGCVCLQLPAGALPTVLTVSPSHAPVTTIAEISVPRLVAPAITTEPLPALDIGSPPLPDDPGAHGLRAPPASA